MDNLLKLSPLCNVTLLQVVFLLWAYVFYNLILPLKNLLWSIFSLELKQCVIPLVKILQSSMIQILFCVYLYKTLYVQKNLLSEYMLLGALEFDGFYLDLSMKENFYMLEFQN